MLRSATITGIVAPREFRPESNFLAGGLSRRLVEVDRHYDDSDVIWQEEVYDFARQLADTVQPARIVDIGTGTGIKLHTSFEGHPALRLQVDWHDERTPLPGDAPQAAFLPANLEDFQDLEALEAAGEHGQPELVQGPLPHMAGIVGHAFGAGTIHPVPVRRGDHQAVLRMPLEQPAQAAENRARILQVLDLSLIHI